MQKINPAFWAKKEEKYGGFFWLPLSQHLEDTRKISGLLWEHWLSEGQRNQIIKGLNNSNEETAKSLVQFLGAVHDLGKATPAFQRMYGATNSIDLDYILWEKIESQGFVDFTSLRLSSPRFSHHALAGQTLLTSFGVNEDIASIIGAHHGRPIDDKQMCKEQQSYPKNYFQSDNSSGSLSKRWQDEQRKIFEWALESNGFAKVADLPDVKQPAQIILSGLLIMADWIASNTNYFPLIPIDSSIIENQQGRMSHAWEEWSVRENWDPQNNVDVLSTYTNVNELYKSRFGFEQPRNMQSIFAEIVAKTIKPGIFILEAPMGGGKTEAALVAAEILASKIGSSGIFFGLPTQATSNGIFPRIENWLDQISKDNEELEFSYRPRLLHGKAALNEDRLTGRRYNLAENVDVDESQHAHIAVNEWFSGRKTAPLDDFVVATVDQFLLLALKQKHLALRHLGFSKKVVIIDEVHAYDAYMSEYLYMAVTWMAAYGVPVIILSATLPAEKREDLVYSYMKGTGLDWERDVIKPKQGLRTDNYPLITYTDGNIAAQFDAFEQEPVKMVAIKRIEDDELEDLIQDFFEKGGVVGVIINTVKRAQELARVCIEKYGKDRVELLHSRFIATDRINKEKNLLEMIGKGAQRPESKIIIGTQVIEQSLDIDFDVLISELAPMDLLIQRIGRLHRHANTKRPAKHQEAVLNVIGTNKDLEFESGSRAVYGDYLLARTQFFLPDELSLPGDISHLVQKVYNEEIPVSFQFDLQEKYREMKKEHLALLRNKEQKADVYRIKLPVLVKSKRKGNSMIGWLKRSYSDATEEKAHAQVRDSNETIEVIAVKKISDGYGVFGRTEDVSGRIDEAYIAKELAKHTVQLPQALSQPYRIDSTISELEKYNLKYLKDWQNQTWLKGALGIVFNENNEFTLNGFSLHYNLEYGLSYERLDDGKV